MKLVSSLKNRFLIIILLIVGFYTAFVISSDVSKISEYFLEIKVELLAIILILQLVSLSIRSYRQKIFLNHLGLKLSFISNFKIYLGSMSLIFTPGGSGTMIKSHFLKEHFGSSYSKFMPIALIERYHDLLAVNTILFLSLIFYYNWASVLIVSISSILLVVIFVIIKNKTLLMKIQKKFSTIKFVNKFIPNSEFNESIELLSKSRIFSLGWLIGISSWVVDATAVYFGFLAFNLDFEFLHTFQIYFTSLSYGAISLLPGGIGLTESSFLGLLTSNGLDYSISSSLVLFVRLTTIWFATVLGFIAMRFILRKNI
jgi:glycosyltransferase 2 family protein